MSNNKISIYEIDKMTINNLRMIARRYLPKNKHFWIKLSMLKLFVINKLSENNLLIESDLINLPFFGQIYLQEGGDLNKALSRLAFDFIPVIGSIGLIGTYI